MLSTPSSAFGSQLSSAPAAGASRLLITGSAGFVGSELFRSAERLWPECAVQGADLPQNLGPTASVALDVRDREACFQVLRKARPTHLLHAAAVTAGVSTEQTIAVNVEGTRNVLDAAIAAGGLQRVVLLSSSGVYGGPKGSAVCDENHPLDLSQSYASTKRVMELEALARGAQWMPPIAVARVGPVYGAGERAGAFRPGVSLIGRLSAALLRGESLKIYGTDYARDWTHSDDIAAAIYGLLRAPRLRHRCYNVSSGVGVSAREVIALFEQRGLPVSWVHAPEDADIVLHESDGRKPMVIERLQTDTGFAPKVTIAQGIEQISVVPACSRAE